jgi:hypothetical protein
LIGLIAGNGIDATLFDGLPAKAGEEPQRHLRQPLS